MPRLPERKILAANRILRLWRDRSVQFWPRISSNPDQGSSQSLISVDPSPSASASETKDGLDEEAATVPTTITQKIHATAPTLPPFPSPLTSPLKSPVLHAEIELPGSPPTSPTRVVNDWKLLKFPSLRAATDQLVEPGRQSILSALDLLRSPPGKSQKGLSSPVKGTSTVLDCVNDNKSIMIYGPLEPDDTSEVEIACSEIVSVYEDGEEIRTLQARFVPLPTESIEQILIGANESPERYKGKEKESCTEADSELFIEPWKSPLSKNGHFPEREYRAWVPSLTKISVQTMRWGFRMWVRFSSNWCHNTDLYFQISSSLRPRGLERQAIGSRQACCDDNDRAQVAYGPHPAALATARNASSCDHSAWTSALFGLRWRIYFAVLDWSQVIRQRFLYLCF